MQSDYQRAYEVSNVSGATEKAEEHLSYEQPIAVGEVDLPDLVSSPELSKEQVY